MPDTRRVLVLVAVLGIVLGGPAAGAADPPGKAVPAVQFAALQERLNRSADAALQSAQEPAPQVQNGTTRDPDLAAGIQEAVRPALRPAAQARAGQLRPLVEPILRSEGIPAEFIAVLLVESGGNPLALSSKGALGLWQFMPETARHYGLRVDAERDDRLDPELSTRAAARYLRDLHQRFGDWSLALAAYNAGVDAVQGAMDKSKATVFESISPWLPLETRNYVPAVLRAMHQLDNSHETSPPPRETGRVIYVTASLD